MRGLYVARIRGIDVIPRWFTADMAGALAGIVVAVIGMVGTAVFDRDRRDV